MLNSTRLKSLKLKDKKYKCSDSNGLYIEVRPNGSKFWRQKYRFNGKEKLLSHGKYPIVSLSEARVLRDKSIKALSDGQDPTKIKRQSKVEQGNTFGIIAKEWHDKQSVNWKPRHAAKVWHQLETDVLPYLKDEPINKISPTDLLHILRRVEKRGALEIASRLRQRCDAIFKHAILSDQATLNPATQLIGVLKTKKVVHRTALDSKELPLFLSKLEATDSHIIVRIAKRY